MIPKTKIIICIILVICSLLLTSCYFGANESYQKIEEDFYLSCWDEHCKIALSKEDIPSFFEGIIIDQSVFAVGHNSDFIIVKQNPNKSNEELDSTKIRKHSTNYFIIDIRWYDEGYKLYSFDNEKEFNKKRFILDVPNDLTYQFYDTAFE
jgi:hypothetical protein